MQGERQVKGFLKEKESCGGSDREVLEGVGASLGFSLTASS